jgi:hypothetical protein
MSPLRTVYEFSIHLPKSHLMISSNTLVEEGSQAVYGRKTSHEQSPRTLLPPRALPPNSMILPARPVHSGNKSTRLSLISINLFPLFKAS